MAQVPQGWSAEDIGGAARGGTALNSSGVMTIFAGGSDIFANHDSFRFIYQPAQQPGDISARVLSLLESNAYTKAGVMARWGNDADAPFAMVNVMPSGDVCLCSRPTKDVAATEKKIQIGTDSSVDVRLNIKDGNATGYYRLAPGDWTLIDTAPVPKDQSFNQGYAVCSHQDGGYTVARIGPAGRPDDQPAPPSTPLADHWQTWGSWNREAGKNPANYTTTSGSPAGLWQDIPVTPGNRYRFAASAAKGSKASSPHIELRLENTLDDHQILLNSTSMPISQGPAVTATSMTDRLRVLILSNGEGTITIDGATLADVTHENDGGSAK
jgi:hypothetical protein